MKGKAWYPVRTLLRLLPKVTRAHKNEWNKEDLNVWLEPDPLLNNLKYNHFSDIALKMW